MKKLTVLTLSIFFILLAATNTFSQQAFYGFKDKYYTGILGNGIQNDNTKFSGLGLNLWVHYDNWNTCGINCW